jgi:hypothetical protein
MFVCCMTSLIACVGTGKGTWTSVMRLIANQGWDKVFIVTNQFGREKFSVQKPVEYIVCDENWDIGERTKAIKEAIAGKIADLEVAVNFVSGTGVEHMAIISAVLKEGLAVRLVDIGESGLVEI